MKRPFKPRSKTRSPVPRNRPKIFNYGTASRSQERTRDNGSKPASQNPIIEKSVTKGLSKAVNYLIVIAIIYGLLYMCLVTPTAHVKFSGEKIYPRDFSSYQQGVDRQLTSSVFYRFKPTFNTSELASGIKHDFPEINDVNIDISPFLHRPTVELSLASPIARLVTPQTTYLLDEDGTALFEEKYASKDLDTSSLLTINDSSGEGIEPGKPALTQQQFNFIREVIGQTKAKGLKLRSFELTGGGTELDVRFEDLGYFVKFSFLADPKQSSGAFTALRNQLQRDHVLPKQYVDLRIPEKAFVK